MLVPCPKPLLTPHPPGCLPLPQTSNWNPPPFLKHLFDPKRPRHPSNPRPAPPRPPPQPTPPPPPHTHMPSVIQQRTKKMGISTDWAQGAHLQGSSEASQRLVGRPQPLPGPSMGHIPSQCSLEAQHGLFKVPSMQAEECQPAPGPCCPRGSCAHLLAQGLCCVCPALSPEQVAKALTCIARGTLLFRFCGAGSGAESSADSGRDTLTRQKQLGCVTCTHHELCFVKP